MFPANNTPAIQYLKIIILAKATIKILSDTDSNALHPNSVPYGYQLSEEPLGDKLPPSLF